MIVLRRPPSEAPSAVPAYPMVLKRMATKSCTAVILVIVGVKERVGSAGAFTYPDQTSKPMRRRRHERSSRVAATAASWTEIEILLGDVCAEPNPASIDSVLDPSPPTISTCRPTLFRERHGWCPYSERVWLALEILRVVPYDTIRIDNTDGPRPTYFSGQTPQIQWPADDQEDSTSGDESPRRKARRQGESRDLVAELDLRYNQMGWMSRDTHVQDAMDRFSKIFPAKARPSSRAAFLFQYSGEPLWRSVLESTLQGVEALLSETEDEGPYFCGSRFTAADLHYLPFLERYRYQLPCLHEGLEPFDPETYPSLARWYRTVDLIPEYACRVKGDASSWAKVLTMHGYGNSGVPFEMTDRMHRVMTSPSYAATIDLALWREYAKGRRHVASTPHAQAVLVMTKNRKAIVADAASRTSKAVEWVDDTLQELSHHLLRMGEDEAADPNAAPDPAVRELARFLGDRMCVPRDMGAMPAACLRKVFME